MVAIKKFKILFLRCIPKLITILVIVIIQIVRLEEPAKQ
jgi:hypothetical protein